MSQSSASENLRKNVRKFIFEHFEEYAIAPVLEQIMQKFELDRTSAFNVLVDLQSARHIALLPGTQRILMAFPFSSIVTPFKVRIARKDKDYFANCAWDAVAIHIAVGKEQWIDSYCHHCAEDLTIHLKDQMIVSEGSQSQALIYLTDRKSTRLNSSHLVISYAVFCLKKKISHSS